MGGPTSAWGRRGARPKRRSRRPWNRLFPVAEFRPPLPAILPGPTSARAQPPGRHPRPRRTSFRHPDRCRSPSPPRACPASPGSSPCPPPRRAGGGTAGRRAGGQRPDRRPSPRPRPPPSRLGVPVPRASRRKVRRSRPGRTTPGGTAVPSRQRARRQPRRRVRRLCGLRRDKPRSGQPPGDGHPSSLPPPRLRSARSAAFTLHARGLASRARCRAELLQLLPDHLVPLAGGVRPPRTAPPRNRPRRPPGPSPTACCPTRWG